MSRAREPPPADAGPVLPLVPAARVALSTAERLPRDDGGGVRARGPARLRRRRGHGLDRPGQPGRHRAAPAVGLPPGPDPGAARAVPGDHAAGLGHRPVGQAGPRQGRRRGAGAETVVVHPPFRWQRDYVRQFVGGIAADGRRDGGAASRSRTCSRCAPARGRCRRTPPTGTRRSRTSAHFTLDLSHTSVSRSDALAMREVMGDRLGARAHRRRQRQRPRRAPRARPRHPARARELLEGLAASGFDGLVVVRGEHPQGARTGPSARPTSPRRSPSPG